MNWPIENLNYTLLLLVDCKQKTITHDVFSPGYLIMFYSNYNRNTGTNDLRVRHLPAKRRIRMIANRNKFLKKSRNFWTWVKFRRTRKNYKWNWKDFALVYFSDPQKYAKSVWRNTRSLDLPHLAESLSYPVSSQLTTVLLTTFCIEVGYSHICLLHVHTRIYITRRKDVTPGCLVVYTFINKH